MRAKVKEELLDMGFKFYPDLMHGRDYELIFYNDSPIPVGFVGEEMEYVENAQNMMEKRKFQEFARLCAKANGKNFVKEAMISF